MVNKLKFSGIDVYDISNVKTPGGKKIADQNMTFWRLKYLAGLVSVKTELISLSAYTLLILLEYLLNAFPNNVCNVFMLLF